ncbi:MAG: hypothetical protein QM820_50320 [Minicystis sp.]
MWFGGQSTAGSAAVVICGAPGCTSTSNEHDDDSPFGPVAEHVTTASCVKIAPGADVQDTDAIAWPEHFVCALAVAEDASAPLQLIV